MIFEKLNIIKPIQKALKDEGYKTPTPIQEKAIPAIFEGRDLLGCAQTGTGKTAAFALPILQNIYNEKDNNKGLKGPRTISAVVLAPTRELAIQIGTSFKAYSCYMNIKNTVIFGGVPQVQQVKALNDGVDIIVATPGRLLDLINQKHLDLSEVKYFVLDEADRMMEMGMIEDVKKIIANLPKERQNMLFSATMPVEILNLVRTILKSPLKIQVSDISSTTKTITQGIYYVDKINKVNLLVEVLKNNEIKNAIVFVRTKQGADKITLELKKWAVDARAIHGDKSQRDRERTLNAFKDGRTRVLVATDVAARGIDIDELSHVINFDFPEVPETYVHRIGRTGRAGSKGTAYSFCDVAEIAMLRDIEKIIGKRIPTMQDNPYPAENVTLPEKNKKNNSRSIYNREKSNTESYDKSALPKKLDKNGNPVRNNKKIWDYGTGNGKGKGQGKKKR